MESGVNKPEIIYQIYPKSFQDSNNDGIGDLRGIIRHLDDLQDLGVTMIWLCPIYPSPMEDNGYDISDYKAVNPDFGTMEDMDELIKQAASRGISLMMDLVLNHTSSRHPWFVRALQDPKSKEHGYYIFESGKQEPNNLRSVFGGSCWEKVDGRDEYYFHSFGIGQPDLNWENPELRKEIYSVIDFWKKKGIRAFRMDAINFIKKPQVWTNLEADGPDGRAKCTKVVRNHPGLLDFLHELNNTCFKEDQVLTVAETAGLPYGELGSYIGENGCFSMVFDFRHADLDIKSGDEWFTRVGWRPSDLKEKLKNSMETVQKYGRSATFIENHDQPRATSKYLKEFENHPQAKKMLALLHLGMPGTPFIYQGQELGMINFSRTNPDQFDDLSSIDQYVRARQHGYSEEEALYFVNLRSRDNARVPYPWNDGPYGGFSEKTPWLAPNREAAAQGITYESEKTDPDSVYFFYRKLIGLRKSGPYSLLLNEGKIRFLQSHPDVIAYELSMDERRLQVYCSFSDKPLRTGGPSGQVVISNDPNFPSGSRIIPENGQIFLEPFEAVLIEPIEDDSKE